MEGIKIKQSELSNFESYSDFNEEDSKFYKNKSTDFHTFVVSDPEVDYVNRDDSRIPHTNLEVEGIQVNERWDTSEFIYAQIISYDKDVVACDCLLDKEESIFEARQFPRHLFDSIVELEEDYPIIIQIKTKRGAIRIDVRDGTGIVDSELFNIKAGWDALRDSHMDDPIEVRL